MSEVIESATYTFPKRIYCSVSHFSQRVFELSENLFYSIEFSAVDSQKALRRPRFFYIFTNARYFIRTEIIHDDYVARLQCPRESLLHISE